MAKIECYTPEGELRMKEPIDARECVEALGFTMEKPCDDDNKAIDISAMKKAQLIELAESKDIELDGNETKAVLIEKIESLNEGE
jgi:hypothetical protein